MQAIATLADRTSLLLDDPVSSVLLATLAIAAVIDARTFRIPNWLTVAGAVLALLYHSISGAPGALGIGAALAGAALAVVLLLPLWILQVTAADDVKLMAVVGAFLGPARLVPALLFTIAAVTLLAVAWAARRGALGQLAANLRFVALCLYASPAHGSRTSRFPYAIGICAGTAAYLLSQQLGLL